MRARFLFRQAPGCSPFRSVPLVLARNAATAALAFGREEGNMESANDGACRTSLSIFAVAALWSGWLTNLEDLRAQAAVIRPHAMYSGMIQAVQSREW